jgi:hypothetical protein
VRFGVPEGTHPEERFVGRAREEGLERVEGHRRELLLGAEDVEAQG